MEYSENNLGATIEQDPATLKQAFDYALLLDALPDPDERASRLALLNNFSAQNHIGSRTYVTCPWGLRSKDQHCAYLFLDPDPTKQLSGNFMGFVELPQLETEDDLVQAHNLQRNGCLPNIFAKLHIGRRKIDTPYSSGELEVYDFLPVRDCSEPISEFDLGYFTGRRVLSEIDYSKDASVLIEKFVTELNNGLFDTLKHKNTTISHPDTPKLLESMETIMKFAGLDKHTLFNTRLIGEIDIGFLNYEPNKMTKSKVNVLDFTFNGRLLDLVTAGRNKKPHLLFETTEIKTDDYYSDFGKSPQLLYVPVTRDNNIDLTSRFSD